MKRKAAPKTKTRTSGETFAHADKTRSTAAIISCPAHESAFREVVAMIEAARNDAFRAVNVGLIDLYWRVGEYISRKLETAVWGEGVVDELAVFLARQHPDNRR